MVAFLEVQLILLSIAIPLHLILLVTLWRFRNKNCFKSAFFKLLFSLTLNDLLLCSFYLPVGFWICNGGMSSDPSLAATLDFLIGQTGFNGNVIGLAAIAINRFVNLVWFTRADQIWTGRSTKTAVTLHWFLAATTVLSFLHPDVRLKGYDSGGVHYAAPNSSVLMAFNSINAAVGLIGTVVVICCYTGCLCKLAHHRLTNSAADGSFVGEIRLFIQGCILSSFLSLYFLTFVGMAFICDHGFCTEWHSVVSTFVFFGNFYSGSVLALAMSKELRKHAIIIVTRKDQNQVGTTHHHQ